MLLGLLTLGTHKHQRGSTTHAVTPTPAHEPKAKNIRGGCSNNLAPSWMPAAPGGASFLKAVEVSFRVRKQKRVKSWKEAATRQNKNPDGGGVQAAARTERCPSR